MKVCTCILLFKILALENSLSQITQRENGRSANPALEPGTEYSNEDTKNLNNTYRHDFIATATDTAPKVKTFTDFILETVNILNTYEDAAFQDFFRILNFEIRNYHYGGCKFSELMQNHNIRKLLHDTLKTIRDNPIAKTKTNINVMADMMRVEIYDHNVKEFLDYINTLYFDKGSEFHRILNNLKRFTKAQRMDTFTGLRQVIRDGVRTILFNHYTALDTYTRRELKDNIETFWERLKKGPFTNAEIINHVIPKTDIDNNIEISKYVKHKDKAPELSIDRKTLRINRATANRDPRERTPSDKRRQAVHMPISPNVEIMVALQSATNDLLKSLSKLSDAETSIFGNDTHTNTSLYQKSARHYNQEPTENKIPTSLMQPQEEIKSQKPIADTESPFDELCPTKQPKELRRRIKPYNNTKVKHFNEFVNLKIKTIQNELTELKQVNDVVTNLTNNTSDEVDVTNDANSEEIKENEELKKMKEKLKKLMNKLHELNNEEVNNYGNIYNPRSKTMKTVSTTNTNTPYIAEVVYRAMDVVDDATSQTTDNNADITKTDTKELNSAVSTDSVTTSSTVAERIIRHKNPFDHIDMKFLSRTL